MRSRVMAVVSVEGGPSRECLDNVFNLLKGNVQCVDEENLLDSDEVGGLLLVVLCCFLFCSLWRLLCFVVWLILGSSC